MKSLSDIARDLGISSATVSYVYNGKWRENRIRPEVAARVRRKLEAERAAPNVLGRQLQSGRTWSVGVLLPHLEQAYFLRLLAGIEGRLDEAGHMLFLGVVHRGRESRQVELLERILARRVDAVLVAPRPASGLRGFLATMRERSGAPLVFVDNYVARLRVARAVSDNYWGARETVRRMAASGRRRILFFGAAPGVAAIDDRYLGYRDAVREAGLPVLRSVAVAPRGGGAAAAGSLRHLLGGSRRRPDGIFASSFLGFLPVLEAMARLGLRHPDDVLLAGFDEPMETWVQDTVRRVIREPLWAVIQRADQMGKAAVDLALAAIAGDDISREVRLIRPDLSWGQGIEKRQIRKRERKQA